MFRAPGRGQSLSRSLHRLFAAHTLRSPGISSYTPHREETWLVTGLLGHQVRMTEGPEVTAHLAPLAEG